MPDRPNPGGKDLAGRVCEISLASGEQEDRAGKGQNDQGDENPVRRLLHHSPPSSGRSEKRAFI